MKKEVGHLSLSEVFDAKQRRLDAQHLQSIEDNPLDAADIAMFEMFERERWSFERRRAHIIDQARKAAARHAAE